MTEKITAEDIRNALKIRYSEPEWELFFEVGNGTGANCSRHIDAIAFNMYPSRGLSIVAIEIKVNKGDLESELNSPNKADAIAKYADYFYLATTKDLTSKCTKEIPSNWGILEYQTKGKLVQIKTPEKIESEPLSRNFIASILRSINKRDNKEKEMIFNAGIEQGIKNEKQQWNYERQNYSKIIDRMKVFEEIVGYPIDSSFFNKEDIKEKWKIASAIEHLSGNYSNIYLLLKNMKDVEKDLLTLQNILGISRENS